MGSLKRHPGSIAVGGIDLNSIVNGGGSVSIPMLGGSGYQVFPLLLLQLLPSTNTTTSGSTAKTGTSQQNTQIKLLQIPKKKEYTANRRSVYEGMQGIPLLRWQQVVVLFLAAIDQARGGAITGTQNIIGGADLMLL